MGDPFLSMSFLDSLFQWPLSSREHSYCLVRPLRLAGTRSHLHKQWANTIGLLVAPTMT
jgi:hypothetical protein